MIEVNVTGLAVGAAAITLTAENSVAIGDTLRFAVNYTLTTGAIAVAVDPASHRLTDALTTVTWDLYGRIRL